jgi:hypothetical protein
MKAAIPAVSPAITNTLAWTRLESEPREPARFRIAAEREDVPPHHSLAQIHRAARRDDEHDDHRHGVQRLREAERSLRDPRQRSGQENALRTADHERDATQDPHRAERDDERMHAQADDHQPVDRAADQADGQRHRKTERHGRGSSGWLDGAEHHRHRHTRERVHRAHREIDPSGNDHHRRAHGHDGEEARVGRGLNEGVRIEEVVDRLAGGAIQVGAREHREDEAEEHDDEHEARLLRRENPPDHVVDSCLVPRAPACRSGS